jgi:hypothetical protein
MKTIKLFNCLTVLILVSVIGNAQVNIALDMPKYKDVAEIKNRQLIVVVNPPDPAIVGKFDKKSMPDVVQQYLQIIGAYNDNMKYFVSKFWKFNSKPVLYKTRAEIDEMMQDKSQRDKYYLMYCYSKSYSINKDLQLSINHNGEKIEGMTSVFSIGYYNESPFYTIAVGLLPTIEELAFYIPTLSCNFNYICSHKDKPAMSDMIDGNAPMLAGKTLLILSDYVNPDFRSEIGKYYPGKFKLVDKEELQRAIVSGDSSCAYAARQGFVYIVNCQDGAIMGYTTKNVSGIDNPKEGLRKDFFVDIGDFCRAGMKK